MPRLTPINESIGAVFTVADGPILPNQRYNSGTFRPNEAAVEIDLTDRAYEIEFTGIGTGRSSGWCRFVGTLDSLPGTPLVRDVVDSCLRMFDREPL